MIVLWSQKKLEEHLTAKNNINQRPCHSGSAEKRRFLKYYPKAHEKPHTQYDVRKDSPVSEGEEHHVKMKMKLINLTITILI